MSKHTAGPWLIDPEMQHHLQPGDIRITTVDWEIAVVTGDAGDADGNDESEANARLVSAAPDLLAALKRLVKEIGAHEPCDREDDEECTSENCPWAQANDAIAKSEGITG